MAERKLSVILTGAAKLGKMVTDADGAFGKVGKAAVKAGKVAVAALTTAGVAAGAALTKGVLDALEADSINAQLQGSLGLSDEEARLAGEAAGDVWASGFGGSLGEVSSATEAVLSSLGEFGVGASSAELKDLTTQAIALSDVFQTDVATAAAAAGGMIRNGLAADGEEAFDLLTSSLQKMPVAIRDELFDAVQEYDVYFAQLGLSGEEAMGLLVSSSGDGTIAVDKVGDALKELTVRGIDMSTAVMDAYGSAGLSAEDMAAKLLAGGDTARGALDEIVAGLSGIEDPVVQAEAAIALMGAPLEDLGGATIPDFLDALASGDSALGDFAGSADKLAGTLDTPGAKIESFKRQALQGLSDAAAKYALPAIEEIGDWIGDRLPGWIDAGHQALGSISLWWETHGPAIQAKAQQLFGTVQEVMAGVVEFVRTNWPSIQQTIQAVMSAVGSVISNVVNVITTLWNNFGDNILDHVNRVWPHIKNVIEGAVNVIRNVVQLVTSLIQGDWSAVWESIKGIVTGVWDVIVGGIGMSIELVKTMIGAALEVIGSVWKGAWNGVKDFVVGIWDKIKSGVGGAVDWVKDKIDGIVGFFTGLPGRIKGGISSLADTISGPFQAGADAIRSAWNSTIGGKGVSIPDIPGLPGRGKRFEIPRLHSGGVVPGGAADEVLRVLQGGEVVLDRGTVSRLAAGGGSSVPSRGGDTIVVVNVEGSVQTERDLAESIWQGINRRALIQGGLGR